MIAAWRRWATIERGLSPRTVEAYERELTLLGPRPAAASTDDLRDVLHARVSSASTTARRIAAWRSYYGFLVRTGQRPDDPTAGLDRPRVRRGLPRPVTDLTARLEDLESPFREIAVLLAETGLRISEACALEVPLPVPDAVTVKGKGSKERLVPLSAEARRALTMLGGRIEPSARTIQRRFRTAGFTPHRLRHTFATELAEADVDLSVIQDLLGHASPATTRVYQANSQARLRSGVERRADARGRGTSDVRHRDRP